MGRLNKSKSVLRFFRGRARFSFLLGLFLSLLAAPLAHAGVPVKVNGKVSGSTLTVYVRTAPGSRCAMRLIGADETKKLPPVAVGHKGRGELEWPIPSDTAVEEQRLTANCGHPANAKGKTKVDIPQSAVAGILSTVLNILLDVLLGGTLLLFLVLLIQMVVQEPNPGERMMRSLALICGALVALGAQAANVGIASYTVESLTGTRPGGSAFTALSVIVPGGVAALFGWYFVRAMRRSTVLALRLVSFLGMLTVITFIVIFAEATNTQGVFLGAAAIPNASFVIGLIGSVVLFNTPESSSQRSSGKLFGSISDFVRRRMPQGSAQKATERQEGRRNPFADE